MQILYILSQRLGLMVSSLLVETLSERKAWVQYLRVIQHYGPDSEEVAAASRDVQRNYGWSVRLACWVLYFAFAKPFGMVSLAGLFVWGVGWSLFTLITRLLH
jgi:hypothetical protein